MANRRKHRPIGRVERELRETKIFWIATEDLHGPSQYFDFLRLTRVRLEVVPTTDGKSAPHQVLERLKQHLEVREADEDDEKWILIDVDHHFSGTHAANASTALAAARQANIEVAASNPCFEVWLLLHHEEAGSAQLSAADLDARLRAALGSFDKTRLREKNFDIGAMKQAIERARVLDGESIGRLPANPGTRIYKLVERLVPFLADAM